MRAEYTFDPVIGGERHTRPADVLIAALADRQHGVVARRQLVALGLSARAIDHRLKHGRLHLLHRGVYAVGHRVLSQRGRWMAAVLACGVGAVLGHRSAAALWGIRPTSRAAIEVTTPRRLRPRTGLLPRCAVLPGDEVTTLDGIPVTTPARTLFDLAGVLTRRPLERALDEAEVLRLEGPAELLARHPGHRGAATLRTLLLNARSSTLTRSELEERFLELVDDAGLPRPETNAIIEGYEVDAVWRDARLIVELDGYATHGTRKAFERDRIRDRTLQARGWRPIRLTSLQLAADPAALAEELLSWIGA